jgi:hypothetical protein
MKIKRSFKSLLFYALCAMLFASFLAGCAGMRGDIVKIMEEDKLNAETSRTAGRNLLSTWSVNSGFVRGSLGPDRMNALPMGVVKAMDELDALAAKTTWTDFELGYSLGLRVRLLSEIVAQALKLYAPEVLKYIPMAF